MASNPAQAESFRLGFIRDVQERIDVTLRALKANRLEDAVLVLERLEKDLRAQAKWEQQA